MQNYIQAAIGIIVLLVVVGGLLFIYYSRTNAVQKTGYGSLIMLLLVSLMIPVFWITQGQDQLNTQNSLFHTAVERGAALYGQYCSYPCFGLDDRDPEHIKVVDPTYNGYTMNDFKSMTDDQVNRIISAGIFNPSPPKNTPRPQSENLIPRSEQYGGALLSNDIDYLRSFLRATDRDYLRAHGYPLDVKPYDDLVTYLQANAKTQYDVAVSYFKNGAFGAPVDLTKQQSVAMDIVDVGQPGATCPSMTACFAQMNIKVKVGTVITWTNKAKDDHTVTAVQGTDLANPKAATNLFDSGKFSKGATYTLTITEAMFNAGQSTSDSNAHQLF